MTKILIIDDEKSILESLSSILEDEGFEVTTARDGREGLTVFKEEKPKVVLLDVWMPEIDGLEVLRQIREEDHDAVVIVISGHGTISTAVEAVKLGAMDFLEKPLSIDKVLEVISRGVVGTMNGKEKTDDVRVESASGLQTRKQRTVGKSVVAYGVGNHSGVYTGMILLPMPPGSGIVFEDLAEGERIPGYIDYVFSSGFASSLKGRTRTIQTVEHLMAACHMYGLTNLLIKVSEEIPFFDGSAQDICSKIEEAGIVEQSQGIEPLVINEKLILQGLPTGKFLSIEPAEDLEIDYTLEYPEPIGVQHYLFSGGKDAFLCDIAPARTFGTIDDFGKLAKTGLGGRGRMSNVMLNVIVVDNEKVINTELRFEDEFVRHKVLDLLGDLYLIGRPVIGKVVARKTGHMENIALVKELKRVLSGPANR
jgi:UDP-3-O-[3-hydroxymyristoyl] N-acetylglucosamine deacetylase